MGKYLKDRRTGELFGFNHEMAKLKWMKEVEDSDDDFNDGKPDPDYYDDEGGFPVAQQASAPTPPNEAEVLSAAKQGEADLGEATAPVDEPPIAMPEEPVPDGEPPWAYDTNGNRLEDGDTGKPLVYVLDKDRNVVIDEATGEPLLEVYQEVEAKPKRKK